MRTRPHSHAGAVIPVGRHKKYKETDEKRLARDGRAVAKCIQPDESGPCKRAMDEQHDVTRVKEVVQAFFSLLLAPFCLLFAIQK